MSGLPEDMVSFLLHTSMLARMDAELCDAVTYQLDSSDMLEQLKARNLFLISLDEHNGWFRYHHLFAEFLQNRLKRLNSERWLANNRAASECFAAKGLVVEAIDHAIAAADSALTESLLDQHAPSLLLQDEFTTLQRWLDSFPEEAMKRSPETALLHAFVLVVTNQPSRAEAILAGIEQQFEQMPAGEQRQQIQSGLLFVKSNLLFTSGLFEQWFTFASGGLDKMLPRNTIYYNFNYNRTEPLVRRTSFGMNGTLSNDTEQIAHLFTNMLHAHNWNESLINLYVLQSLCEGYYEWNRLEDAAAIIPVIDRAARASQTPGLFVPNRITQSFLYMALGQSYLAHDTIDEAFQTVTKDRLNQHWKQALTACKIRLYIMEGRVAAAKKELPKLHISAKDRPVFNRYFEYMTLVRLLKAQHKEADALRLLSLLKPQAVRENCVVSMVEITIVEAVLAEQLGQMTNALRLLHEALTMTEAFGYVRSYLDEGEQMQLLLRRYRQQRSSNSAAPPTEAVSDEYVAKLLEQFPGKADELPAPKLEEALSKSEMQLLQLIRQGASNKEIGKTLSLKEGTVKVYVSRIYAKLDVSSRTQALLAAQRLQLLDEA